MKGTVGTKGTVGIKEANGNFYPIVEVNSPSKKRLLLTTAHDNQKSVQIDLYKSNTKSMKDALYIGSIVVENIAPKPKGKASIEMILNSNADGTLSVNVKEAENPLNEYHLSISLNSLEEDKNNYSDFETGAEGGRNKARVKRQKQDWSQRRKFPWTAVIIGAVILALALLALWFFLFKGGLPIQKFINDIPVQKIISSLPFLGKSAPKTTTPKTTAAKAAPEPSAVTEPVVIERPPDPPAVTETPAVAEPPKAADPPKTPNAAGTTAAPKRTANRINAPRTIPPEGVIYKVRWGDTLWDISMAFYRNPRLYTFIARSNGISNPNRIISGTELTILPRN